VVICFKHLSLVVKAYTREVTYELEILPILSPLNKPILHLVDVKEVGILKYLLYSICTGNPRFSLPTRFPLWRCSTRTRAYSSSISLVHLSFQPLGSGGRLVVDSGTEGGGAGGAVD
jgi:hypothetical protein